MAARARIRPPQASVETILENLVRNLDRKIEERLNARLEENFGGLSKGGFLNAGMLFGSIPAREVVRNTSGVPIAKGAPVYVAGDSSGITLVAKADSDADATMPAVGLLGESIANNANGMLIKVGRLDGLDTSAWATGTVLYVSGTAGTLTSTAPSSRVQPVAVVIVQHATTGAVEVFAGYTQAAASGSTDALSWKQTVRVATAVAGTLASSFENGDTVDGVVLATGDRILIKNQAAGAENGIYTVNASGAPTRATDANTAAEILGAAVLVQEGTANADTGWHLTTNAPITLGTTALVFAGLPVKDHAHTGAADGGSTLAPKVVNLGGSISVTSLTGTVNDYTPTGWPTCNILEFQGSTGNATITGFGAPAAGTDTQLVLLLNHQIGVTLTLSHQNAGSSAANRIICPGAVDYVVGDRAAVWLLYNNLGAFAGGTNPRWYVLGSIRNHTHAAAGEGGTKLYPSRIGTTAVTHDMAGANGTTTNNLNVVTTDGMVLRFTNAFAGATNNLTGIVAPTDATAVSILVVNDSLAVLQLVEASASSSAGNRFHSSLSATLPLQSGQAVWIHYSSVSGTGCWIIGDILHTHNHSTNTNGGLLTNTAIDPAAEIQVSKLADGAALEVIRTASDGVTVEWGPAPLVKLAETIVTGSVAASIDFSSIPATYRHLLVYIHARSDDTTGTLQTIKLQFNNDSGSNYDSETLVAVGTTVLGIESLGQTGLQCAIIATDAAANTAGFAGGSAVLIPNYAAATFSKLAISPSGAHSNSTTGTLQIRHILGCWRTVNTAINRLTFFPTAGNFKIGSVISVYGVPA